jgi:hypothetical protein
MRENIPRVNKEGLTVFSDPSSSLLDDDDDQGKTAEAAMAGAMAKKFKEILMMKATQYASERQKRLRCFPQNYWFC